MLNNTHSIALYASFSWNNSTLDDNDQGRSKLKMRRIEIVELSFQLVSWMCELTVLCNVQTDTWYSSVPGADIVIKISLSSGSGSGGSDGVKPDGSQWER